MFSLLTAAKEFSIEQYHAKIDFKNDGHTNKADDVRVITIMIAGLFLRMLKLNFLGFFRNFDSRTILFKQLLCRWGDLFYVIFIKKLS